MTSVLVLAGPQRKVTEPEQERIAKFVEQGGRVLVMLDPETQTGLEHLLLRWGIETGRGTVVDVQDRLAQGDLTSLLVRTFTEHEITQDFKSAVLFPLSRYLSFNPEAGKDWHFVPLARTSVQSWVETDSDGLRSRVVQFNADEDIKGPLALAAALTPKEAPQDGQRAPAVVIVGNSSFASNGYVNFPGNTDFLLHAVAWLAEEHALISITPKDPGFRPFVASPMQQRILLYVQVLLLPGVTALWGMHVWRTRRRL